MKIYVASSWKNELYPEIVQALESAGHKVWDWRNPPTGGKGFKWSDCAVPEYTPGGLVITKVWHALLSSEPAAAGYASDLCGMNWCDVGILLHPCGKSAHLEAGWIAGRGKKVHVLAPFPVEPDLMVLALNGKISDDINDLMRYLK